MHRFVDRLIGNGECVAGGLTLWQAYLAQNTYGSSKAGTKKPPVGGFATLLIALIVLFFPMVPVWDLPTQHERRAVQDIFQEVNT
ncbi:hypothetical protein [Citrobacter braakii]|uniref:hypothetical protein n=1 Tax=Citrobacter braakii TaxID=57706 RepID=UPI0039756593